MRSYWLAFFRCVRSLPDWTYLTGKFLWIPIRFLWWADTCIGPLRIERFTNRSGIVKFGSLRASFTLIGCVVVDWRVRSAFNCFTGIGSDVEWLPSWTLFQGWLACLFDFVPSCVIRTFLAFLDSAVVEGSSLIAFFTVEGFCIPERRLWRTHTDLTSGTVGLTFTSGWVIDLINSATDTCLTFLGCLVVGLTSRTFDLLLFTFASVGWPSSIWWTFLAFICIGVVRRSWIRALIAGQITCTPERGWRRTLWICTWIRAFSWRTSWIRWPSSSTTTWIFWRGSLANFGSSSSTSSWISCGYS